MASNRDPNFKIVCCNFQCNVKAKLCMETKYLIRENLINWTRDDLVSLSVFVFSGADGGPLLPAGGPMQLSHEPQDLENSNKYFCRVKIFRLYHPGAGWRFTIALRVWLLPRQSLPLWCQLWRVPAAVLLANRGKPQSAAAQLTNSAATRNSHLFGDRDWWRKERCRNHSRRGGAMVSI